MDDKPTASRAQPDADGALVVRRVEERERVLAAARLVGGMSSDARHAGRLFVQRAASHGIDLDLLWAVFPKPGVVSQAALIVPQVGRTAMIFLSGPGHSRMCGSPERQRADRISVIKAAISGSEAMLGGSVHLFQALPSPDETWAIEAFGGGGLTRLGDLAYMKRPFAMRAVDAEGEWPAGVQMRPIGALDETGDLPNLRRALERTYIDTLDCPGLCSLRTTDDVIESHKSAGKFDPAHWWIIEADGEAEGCVLLSPSPEMRSLELVYMGLGPALRGKRLAVPALRSAILRAQRLDLDEVSCAVDMINEPARAVYARLGFTEFARRIAFVRPSAAGPGA